MSFTKQIILSTANMLHKYSKYLETTVKTLNSCFWKTNKQTKHTNSKNLGLEKYKNQSLHYRKITVSQQFIAYILICAKSMDIRTYPLCVTFQQILSISTGEVLCNTASVHTLHFVPIVVLTIGIRFYLLELPFYPNHASSLACAPC